MIVGVCFVPLRLCAWLYDVCVFVCVVGVRDVVCIVCGVCCVCRDVCVVWLVGGVFGVLMCGSVVCACVMLLCVNAFLSCCCVMGAVRFACALRDVCCVVLNAYRVLMLCMCSYGLRISCV